MTLRLPDPDPLLDAYDDVCATESERDREDEWHRRRRRWESELGWPEPVLMTRPGSAA